MSVILIEKSSHNVETITDVTSVTYNTGASTYTIAYSSSSTKTVPKGSYYIQILWS